MNVHFFFLGFGNGITMVSSITAVMQYYHHKNTGTSLGQLDSGQSLFPLIFIFLYNTFFAGGHYEDPINQDLGGFLLLIAVCFAVFNLCGVLFYFPPDDSGRSNQSEDWCILEDDVSLSQDRFYISNISYSGGQGSPNSYTGGMASPSSNGLAELKEDSPVLGTVSPKLKIYHSDSSESSDPGTHKLQVDSPPSLCQLLSYARFWCIALGVMMNSGLVTMHINNLTTYLAAFNLDEYAAIIPYINPIFSFLCKNIIGFVSDRLEQWVAKPWWLIAAYIAFAIVSVLAIFYLNTIAFVTIFYITVDASGSLCAVISKNLLITYFGIHAFPVGFGFAQGMTALTVILFQYVFGVMYDTQIVDDNTTSCYGLHCFTNSLLMSAVVCVAALLLALYLLADYYSCHSTCCPRKKQEQNHE